jgi:hypothetical protein
MADSDKEEPKMLHDKSGARGLTRIGLGFACVSSVLVLAGPTSAAADEVSSVRNDRAGHFTVQLSGQEVPEGGDPNGQGSGQLNLNAQQQTACATINWKGLAGNVTALHLHIAARGSEGPHWVDFFNDKDFPGADGTFSGCVPAAQDKIRAVIDNPASYYLNVHSTAFAKGAIRGQLN